MGKSSTGKDTISEKLLNNKELKLKTIITYTTRPKRKNEKDGREYYFIDDHRLNTFIDNGKAIEVRRYNTVDGIWSYATIADGQIDIENNNYLLIGTLEAFLSLEEYFGTKNIIPIYIFCDDDIRLERALERERKQANPNYEEMCRRFLADCKDFSEEKLTEANINIRYRNDNLKKCVEEIQKDILQYIK